MRLGHTVALLFHLILCFSCSHTWIGAIYVIQQHHICSAPPATFPQRGRVSGCAQASSLFSTICTPPSTCHTTQRAGNLRVCTASSPRVRSRRLRAASRGQLTPGKASERLGACRGAWAAASGRLPPAAAAPGTAARCRPGRLHSFKVLPEHLQHQQLALYSFNAHETSTGSVGDLCNCSHLPVRSAVCGRQRCVALRSHARDRA